MTGTKQRLSALRKQNGAALSDSRDLAARIDRLRIAGRPVSKRSNAGDPLLAEHLGGRVHSPGLVLVEKRLPLSSRHGDKPLCLLQRQLDDLPGACGKDPESLLFIDSETTGLSGGSGTLIFMLGMARIERNDFSIRQYILSRFCGERALLHSAGEWAGERDALVSYNGRSFDLPLLSTRCRMAGLADPFIEKAHLDLLYPVRRAFSGQWEDCRLATVEKRLLGFRRRHDLPGSQAPGAWRDWIRFGNPGRLPGVLRHNQWDILSLAVLMPVLSSVYQSPSSHQADLLAIVKELGRRGYEERALSLLQDQFDRLNDAALLELARLLKKKGRLTAAFLIWQRLAKAGSEQAREQLAKYYEHVTRDYRNALAWAVRLPDQAKHQHRCRRLRRKLVGSSGQEGFESQC